MFVITHDPGRAARDEQARAKSSQRLRACIGPRAAGAQKPGEGQQQESSSEVPIRPHVLGIVPRNGYATASSGCQNKIE